MMELRAPEHWLEISVWQELLDGWQSHKGSRNAAHAHLQARFKAALGTDFDLCVYDGLHSADTLHTIYLTKHSLKQSKQHRKNFRNRVLAPLRDAWVATQRIPPLADQSILEFESKAQRYTVSHITTR
jgi:hypothetical protein